ncbi:MAG: formyl transferase [Thermoplasmata archaeon]|nr:MAG: formyl transferase [Thermoplasmata archaeon]
MTYKLGWFSSGRDEAARELLTVVYDAIQSGFVPAKIEFVFSNRDPGQDPETDAFFELVKSYGLPFVTFSSKHFKPDLRRKDMEECRRVYDREVMKGLMPFTPDLCVLAGYMLITGEELCREFTMINLHPAEPGGPTGTWQEVIWQLLKEKAGRTGVMMHLVTPVLDRGPPITYCTFPIRDGKFDALWEGLEKKLEGASLEEIAQKESEAEPLFAEIRKEGVRRELPLIIQTIKEFAEGRVRVEGEKIIVQGKVLSGAYDLSGKIEEQIAGNKFPLPPDP